MINKVIGDIEFVSESHIHLGDHEPGSSRLAVMRLSENTFIIPSSSWKGCFRRIAENLAPTMTLSGLERLAVKAYDAGEYRLDPQDEEFKKIRDEFRDVLSLGKRPSRLSHDMEGLKRFLKDIGYSEEIEGRQELIERSLDDMVADYLASFCPLGRLFGNHVLASKLRFHDTILNLETRKIEVRPGVGIDRSSGTAKEDHLFFVEALPMGKQVRMRFIADNMVPGSSDSKLLAGVLDWIDKLGLQIGGRKSVGLGLLKPVKPEFYIIDLTKENPQKAIVNPWRYGDKKTLGQILKWLMKQ
ncbi:MAG: RAMP superfamily CRISPR-associated protein [Candidatus Caldarchaeum sp.]